jgi:hypothetical protein
MNDWTIRKLEHTDIDVGVCAWRLPMLAGPDRDYVKAYPSLIVVDPTDSDELLQQAGPHTAGLPVLLGISEPAFARQLEATVMQRLELMGRNRVDALVLHVDDPSEIKSGGMLQTMFGLRERGVVGCLGLAHPDANVAEWLTINSAVRLLGTNYALGGQSARHRAISSASEYGMSTFALECPSDDQSVRFALAETGRVLPVMDRPIPAGLMPMSAQEVALMWQQYGEEHPPPPPLQRGKPPMLET